MNEEELPLKSTVRFISGVIVVSFIFTLTGCEQGKQPAVQTANPPVSSLASESSQLDVEHKETVRPSARPPRFVVFKEDVHLAVAFVVPLNTTNEQLKSLLWMFRDKVHSNQFADLGLKSVDWGKSGKGGGLFQVYRGPKCANEMYVVNGPCGNAPHTAAYFQWGLQLDPNRDAGHIQNKDGSEDLIFGYGD